MAITYSNKINFYFFIFIYTLVHTVAYIEGHLIMGPPKMSTLDLDSIPVL